MNNVASIKGPKDTVEIIQNYNEIDNLFLKFNLFLTFKKEREGKVKIISPKIGKINELVTNKHERQEILISKLAMKYKIRRVKATVLWRIIIGLGQEHVSETSMRLDFIKGVPFIPASAIKGVVRQRYIEMLSSYFTDERLSILENILERYDSSDLKAENKYLKDKYKISKDSFPLEKTLEVLKTTNKLIEKGQQIFGTQNKVGQITFLDAYMPTWKDNYAAEDTITPHFSKYYNEKENQYPTDSSNPLPIDFITIQEADFNFYFLGRDKELVDFIWDGKDGLLADALSKHGIGAKTSVGYGYFHDFKDILVESIDNNSHQKFSTRQKI